MLPSGPPDGEVVRPASFLMVLWDGGGAVPPFLSLARQLADRGHDVALLGTSTLAERAHAARARFFPFEQATCWSPTPDRAIEQDMAKFVYHLVGPEMAADLEDRVRELRPDVLVIDHMAAGAMYAAERLDVPTAILGHNFYRPWIDGVYASRWERVLFVVNGARRRLALDPLDATGSLWAQLWSRADATLVACPELLDEAPPELPVGTCYVGPLLEVSPVVGTPPERPRVLVTLSSTYMRQEDVLQRVADALAEAGLDGVMTIGAGAPVRLRVPPNLEVLGFTPHAEVLPAVHAVVTHAGLATIHCALAYGVPLVCLPSGRDQPHNAKRVEAVGAGRALPPDAPVAEIAAALVDVVGDGGYRAAALRMAEHIASYRNGALAIDALETMSAAAAPVSPPDEPARLGTASGPPALGP